MFVSVKYGYAFFVGCMAPTAIQDDALPGAATRPRCAKAGAWWCADRSNIFEAAQRGTGVRKILGLAPEYYARTGRRVVRQGLARERVPAPASPQPHGPPLPGGEPRPVRPRRMPTCQCAAPQRPAKISGARTRHAPAPPAVHFRPLTLGSAHHTLASASVS